MAISYRTIQDPGKRLRAKDKSIEAAGKGFAQGYATMSAIVAQVNAQREQAKREQEAKDTWRDQQMADVTDTTFVEKVHGSIHENAYSWLKQKQQRYAELTDMLLQEGMNSRNEQWADIQNERKRIEGAYHNFSKNLDAFKTARQNTAEMRGPDIEGGEYNEVAKTPNSENALSFLYDREFGEGYGDIEIADDGSFTFPNTEWKGDLIGSGNLPTLVEMPYKQQQALQKRELIYGQEIKNKSFKIDDESNNARIRNEIHQEFRGMGVGELQAYILNDMDGEGGTPAFIGQLAPGENPEFTWKDHQGNEQKMFYNDLMQSKDAMVSFATANEYQGTLQYMRGMIPTQSGPGTKQAPTNITSLIKDSIVRSQNEFGEDVGINNKASNKNIATALANNFPSGYGGDEFASREAAFIAYKDNVNNGKFAKIDDETIRGLIQMEDAAGGKKISDKRLLQLMKEYDDYGLVMQLYKDFINKFQDKELFLQTKGGGLVAPKINLQDENQVWVMLNQLKMVSKNQSEVMYDFTNPGALDN